MTHLIFDGIEYSVTAEHEVYVFALVEERAYVCVPEYIVTKKGNAYRVVGLCNRAFEGSDEMKVLSLPFFIHEIDASGFCKCPNLRVLKCKHNM